jgi:hypothetical protein
MGKHCWWCYLIAACISLDFARNVSHLSVYTYYIQYVCVRDSKISMAERNVQSACLHRPPRRALKKFAAGTHNLFYRVPCHFVFYCLSCFHQRGWHQIGVASNHISGGIAHQLQPNRQSRPACKSPPVLAFSTFSLVQIFTGSHMSIKFWLQSVFTS